MKRNIVIFLLLLALSFLFVACDISVDEGQGSEGEESDEGGDLGGEEGKVDENPPIVTENVIFSPDVSVEVVTAYGVMIPHIDIITSKIYSLTSKFALTKSDDFAVSGKEIVIGETTREISTLAKAKLDLAIEENNAKKSVDSFYPPDYQGYLIYSTGDAVAIVWSENSTSDDAIGYFWREYLGESTLTLEAGYTDLQIQDTLNDTIDERIENDKLAEEIAFEKARDKYGDELVEALKAHLAMFDESYYEWLADLYDPGQYDDDGNPIGGGFYFSDSGRDNEQFRIDLESTAQVLAFITNSGMLDSTSETRKYIPERMQKEMVAFALSCQSSKDGYFYHPQWGEDIITSRKSRDLNWATSILSRFGSQPYYNTPNGVKGSIGAPGVSAVSALTEPLTASKVAAVSKVISASANVWTGSDHLSTITKWTEYLNSFAGENGEKIRSKSYSTGNTIGSQAGQIKARDALAVENGELPQKYDEAGNAIPGRAEGGYIDAVENFYNYWQLDTNGLWEECSVEDGTVYYNAINGLMKISGTYNTLGIKYPNANKALECAVFMVTYLGADNNAEDRNTWADSKGKKPTGSVDVYNPWVAICNLLNNIKNYYSAEESVALRQQISENALEMVKVTTLKVAQFEKDNGQWGYNWGGSGGYSQSAPVAISGTWEGDVNGGNIAFTGVWGNMTSALGITVKPFDFEDFTAFITRAYQRPPVEKIYKVNEPATFDKENVGSRIESVTSSMGEGSAEIIADPRANATGNVLSFTTIGGGSGYGSSIVRAKTQSDDAIGLALEWEMCFTEVNNKKPTLSDTTIFQIKMGGTSYMPTVLYTSSGGFRIGDSSNTSLGKPTTYSGSEFGMNEWHKFRIEYCVLDEAEQSTKAKLYIDDVYIGESTNYYYSVNDDGTKTNPKSTYTTATFYAMQSADLTVLFDNIHAYDITE